jgi:general secretion pathway protein E/type IV pilus assembly protein PilB
LEALDYIPLTLDLQQVITSEQAWHYGVVPKLLEKDRLELYFNSSRNKNEVIDELEILFGRNILLEQADPLILQKTLSKYYRRNQSTGPLTKKSLNARSEDFLKVLISEAKELGSSDIHIEIYDDKCRIRIRIDGLLIERYALSKSEYPTIINKIKIEADCDIAEKRLPQDGRIKFTSEGIKIDIRVSILPTMHGEKIVLRLLNNDAAHIDMERLGFSDIQRQHYMEGVKKPHGILLISGPTGSGKTTTLYATLKLLNKTTNNILTIEDPIEYTLEGINQVQLKEDIGLTFASALRTFLRQDPDIIMLGEIRDGETAQMAVRAALTGHLVLSTIHTNSAWGTVARLIDMGLPPFLVANTLNTSVAQRLVRTLCPHCKQGTPTKEGVLPHKYVPAKKLETHFVPVGCEHCHFTGYKGRKAVYEVIPIDKHLGDCIKNNTFTIREYLKENQITTLADNAFDLLYSGQTSIDEVYSLLMND